jgi:hypothetical protein
VKKWLPSLSMPALSRTPSVISRSSRGCSIRSSNEHIVNGAARSHKRRRYKLPGQSPGRARRAPTRRHNGRSSKEDEAAPPAR